MFFHLHYGCTIIQYYSMLLIHDTCTGQPLLSLENSAHFSILESESITFHLKNKAKHN